MADEQEDIQMTFAKMMFGDALNDDELRMISGVEGVSKYLSVKLIISFHSEPPL
jgi:hypothetical protein